jgi:hypothetical protein
MCSNIRCDVLKNFWGEAKHPLYSFLVLLLKPYQPLLSAHTCAAVPSLDVALLDFECLLRSWKHNRRHHAKCQWAPWW